MINTLTILSVKDNSSLKYIKVIKILGNTSFKATATLGDLVISSIYERKKINIKEKKKAIKNVINKMLIISIKKPFLRKDGSFILYDKSCCIFFNNDIKSMDIKDKRQKINLKIFVPILKEFNSKGYKQVLYSAKKIY